MADNQQVTTRAAHPLVTFRSELEARAQEIKMALPAGIDAARFQRVVLTAAQQNPELLSADRRSLILACIKSAQDGLVPDGREAALVVFSTRVKEGGEWKSKKLVQYMPMVFGLRKKILQARDADGHPIISALQVGVVYRVEAEKGYFRWERGSDPEVQHRPMLDITAEEAADEEIVAAYSIAVMSDGTRSAEVLRRFEIDKIREMSQTGAVGRTAKWDDSKAGIKKGDPIPPKGPWVDWFAEMAKKTAMRRHSKTLPMSGDVLMSLGSEDEHELDPSLSTAAVLGSQAGSAPELLEDGTGDNGSEDPPHDRETGEIHEEGERRQATDAGAESQPAKARRGRPRKADAQPASDTPPNDDPPEEARKRAAAEGNGSAGHAEPVATTNDATRSDVSAQSSTNGAPTESGDLLGFTAHPAEAAAERWLEKFGNAKTLTELDADFEDSEIDREGMPDDILSGVLSGYHRHQRRLGRNIAEPAQ